VVSTASLALAPELSLELVRLLSASAAAGMGIALFTLSIVIAGVLLSYGDRTSMPAYTIAKRRDTVQSVTRGILGVALIQATLAGIGMLLVLLMAVIQLPTVLLLVPMIVYVFATSSSLVAVPFAIWFLGVALSDNVLKPILLGRGAPVPCW